MSSELAAEIERLREREARAARLIGLLRRQVYRLWAYHDWVGDHECPSPKPLSGFEAARIVVTRTLTDEGEDRHDLYVEPDDLGLVEALGLLRLAEDTLIQFPPAEN